MVVKPQELLITQESGSFHLLHFFEKAANLIILEIEKDGSTLEMSKSPLGPPKNVESQNLLRCLQLLLFN